MALIQDTPSTEDAGDTNVAIIRRFFLPNCKQLNGSMCSFLFGVVLHSVLSLAPFGNIISFEKVSSPLQLYPNCQHQKSNLMIMSKESMY